MFPVPGPTRKLAPRSLQRSSPSLLHSDMRLVDGYKVYARRELVAIYGTGTPDLDYQYRRITAVGGKYAVQR